MSWLYEPTGPYQMDEDDVRIRPNPKGSRPRTKRRPNFDDAITGMVTQVHLARYVVLLDDGREVLATLAKELRKQGCVTCDRVALAGDVSETKGSLARIVRIEPRTTALSRSSDDGEIADQTIVANADQLVIVMAAANPEPRPRLVDRYLVAAYHQGLKPILIMTKCDLQDPADFVSNFEGFDLEIIKTRSDKPNLEAITALLQDHTTVFVGHSGVGKTTLINQLAPDFQRAVGIVNDVTGRGKHTSSSAKAIEAHGGWLVDTPGIRTFGIAGIEPQELIKGFADLSSASADCPRGCTHLIDAPDCALDALSAEGQISALRLDSFRRLVDSIRSVD